MSSSNEGRPAPARVLNVGDVVNLGGGRTPWEVVDPGHWSNVGPVGGTSMIRMVELRSRRSGVRRWEPSRDLRWPDTREPVDGHPMPPTATHPDDEAGAPLGSVQPVPVRVVTVPANYLPDHIAVVLVPGVHESVLLVADDASDADVCAASADVLADYLTNA